MKRLQHSSGRAGVALAIVISVWFAGCTWLQRRDAIATERMLAAAGFKMRFADTPGRRADLQDFPQRTLVAQNRSGIPQYVYVDKLECQCIYVGDEAAYQRYQKMVFDRNLEDERAETAQMNHEAALDWSEWGPWPWY